MEDLSIIQNKIYEIRGQKVMLDSDLAALYQVETKALKQAVRRNVERFPADFMFELTDLECESFKEVLRSQIVTLKKDGRGKHSKYAPFVFTEQGATMLSAILKSVVAVQTCISIMRSFIQMRNYLSAHSAAVSDGAVSMRLLEMERKLDQVHELRVRLDMMEQSMIAQAETQSLRKKAPAPQSQSAALPECFSENIDVLDYSAKAVVVVAQEVEDQRLLISISAHHNAWLTWNGERIQGWVYPKSRMEILRKYIPENVKEQKRKDPIS